MIPVTLRTPSVAAAASAKGSCARRLRSSLRRTGTRAAVSAIIAVAAISFIPPQSEYE